MEGYVPPGADAVHYAQERLGEKTVWRVAPPEGRLVVHDNRVFRVAAVSAPANEDGHGLWHWTLRPERRGEPDGHFESDKERFWRVLPAHHAICVECREPVPCRRLREQWAAVHAARRAKRIMSIPEGACWSCHELITTRQASVEFPGENLFLPAGPTVTFHIGRMACRRSAMTYQDSWIAADNAREPLLTWNEPYTGRPNPTQRQLLALAARGELRCSSCLVYSPGRDADLGEIMAGRADDTAECHWYPSDLTRLQQRYLQPLIDAGLIAAPPPRRRGGEKGRYRLTEEGSREHQKYPPKGGSR